MKDEELMRQVARAMQSELEAEAAQLAPELDSKLATSTRDRLVEDVMAQLARPRPSVQSKPTKRVAASHRALLGLGALAACASVASAVYLRDATHTRELPAYASSATGGVQKLRSSQLPAADEAPLRLGAAGQLEWLIRPERPVAGAIGVRTWYRQRSRFEPLPVAAEVSEQGSVRITGSVADWHLPQGEVVLVTAVGRQAELPRSSAELSQLMTAGTNQVRIVTLALEISP